MAGYTRVASNWFCELNVPALCVAAALGATMASSSQAGPPADPTFNPTGCALFETHGANDFHIHLETGFTSCIATFAEFSLLANQVMVYDQADSAPFRVLTNVQEMVSSIAGTLRAIDGQLYFVNPNGITFELGSLVEASSFYAVAGFMDNEDFLGETGDPIDRFTDIGGDVINESIDWQVNAIHLNERQRLPAGLAEDPSRGERSHGSDGGSSEGIGQPRGARPGRSAFFHRHGALDGRA